MDWETLKTDCLACQRCPLHTTRRSVVFGQGVENAEVLFVGEGPGQSEDEQGLPFVGRSRRNCSRSHGIQASLSAGRGSRFWGGRHLTMLAM